MRLLNSYYYTVKLNICIVVQFSQVCALAIAQLEKTIAKKLHINYFILSKVHRMYEYKILHISDNCICVIYNYVLCENFSFHSIPENKV